MQDDTDSVRYSAESVSHLFLSLLYVDLAFNARSLVIVRRY